MRVLKRLLIFVTLVIFPLTSLAFDTKMHVYVGEKVLEDVLDDGMVNIPPFGDIPVPNNVYQSIKDNQSVYLAGNLGPDAYPDIIGGQMTTHPGRAGGMQTDDWLELVLESATNPRERAFAYGYLGHAAADVFAHSYVNQFSGDVFSLSDGETDVEIRHSLVERYMAKFIPSPYRNDIPNRVAYGESLPVDFIKNTLLLNDQVSGEYNAAGVFYLPFMYEMENEVGRTADRIRDLRIDIPLDDYWYILDQVQEYNRLLLTIPQTILVEVAREVCEKEYSWTLFGLVGKTVCKEVIDLVEKANEEYYSLLEKRDALASDLARLYAFQGDIYTYLRIWEESLKKANRNYILTSSYVSRELMKSDGAPYDEFSTWLWCNVGVYGSVPSSVNGLVCEVRDWRNDLLKEIERLDFTATALVAGIGTASIIEIKEKIKEEAVRLIQREGIHYLSNELDVNVQEILDILSREPSDFQLELAFGHDSSSKNLLLIDDVASRIRFDMGVSEGESSFDPSSFNVLYNAIVLSKLSLLDSSSLTILTQRANVSNGNIYPGPYLYYTSNNILFDAVKSIDGNHQWMEISPPYLRRAYPEGFLFPSYGYSHDDGVKGFRLWADGSARENVFRSIFKGPIAPSLEDSQRNGFENLIPADYPYDSCSMNPFPDPGKYSGCDMAYMVPILGILLQ